MLLLVATWQDIKTGRIPNILIYAGLLAGAAYRIAGMGLSGAQVFLFSIIWPFALLYILFYIRALGAGDIKLFCMISPFLTFRDEIKIMILSFFIGAGFSCYRIFKNREFSLRFSLLGSYFINSFSQKKILRYSTLKKNSSYVRFSTFILAAYILIPVVSRLADH